MPDTFGPPKFMSSYDNDLVRSPDDALWLLRNYSVHPPDKGEGISAKSAQGDERRTDDHQNGKEISYRHMGRKVARLHLHMSKRGHKWEVKSGTEGGDVLVGDVTYEDDSPGNPVYWLPWDTAGAIVKLKIPQMGTRAVGDADPNLFFTAAINGCSVFIDGPANAPTVYHAGGSTGCVNPHDGAQFWRTMMNQLGRGFSHEVNKEDYVANSNYYEKSKNLFTTEAAKDYLKWLRKDSSKTAEIEEVAPWGCVMGMRNPANGNWKFYLQENCSITYYTLIKVPKKHFGSKRVRDQELDPTKAGNTTVPMIDKKRTLSRPIRVNEVFPNRSYNARVFRSIPRLVHG